MLQSLDNYHLCSELVSTALVWVGFFILFFDSTLEVSCTTINGLILYLHLIAQSHPVPFLHTQNTYT